MAGGAAVIAALGAIAELGLPLSVTGIVPACENMLSGTAIRPTDVIRTAAGLTVVDAGNTSGDLADLHNTAGKSFGFPIVAATFLHQFAADGPWAHVDMLGPAFLDEDRGDAFGRGASGYGVRMLVELASRLSVTLAR